MVVADAAQLVRTFFLGGDELPASPPLLLLSLPCLVPGDEDDDVSMASLDSVARSSLFSLVTAEEESWRSSGESWESVGGLEGVDLADAWKRSKIKIDF